MTFLHIITGLPVAGAEVFLLRVVKEGAKRGHSHRIINLGSETRLARDIAVHADILNLDIRKSPLRGALNFFRWGLKWRKGATIISGWMYYGSILTLLIGVGTKAQKLGHIRHTPILLENESWRIKATIWILKYVARNFSSITYNSIQAQDWHENFGILAPHSRVIDNGYPETDISVLEKEYDVCSPFTIGAASRNHPMKNQLGILRAFARLLEKDPTIKLVLVGRGTEKLAKTSEFLTVSSQVSLYGEVNNMTEFFDSLNLFVSFSSWGESFQNVVAEAMARGVPALATDIGAAQKIVIDDTCLLPIGDEEAFVVQVLRLRALSRDKIAWTSYRKRCHKKIMQDFSIPRAYDNLLFGD